ncbi:MAG: VOC family protein [Deinococcales bacterium]
MIKALAHVCIESSDLEKTLWFYGDVLGMSKQFDFIKEGKRIGFYLKADNLSFIEVFVKDKVIEGNAKIKHLCLQVEDIEALEQQLLAHNIAAYGKKMGNDQSYQLWCKDPDGVDIEFQQYTPQSTQFTGENCIL